MDPNATRSFVTLIAGGTVVQMQYHCPRKPGSFGGNTTSMGTRVRPTSLDIYYAFMFCTILTELDELLLTEIT